jgi:hypothetical protein
LVLLCPVSIAFFIDGEYVSFVFELTYSGEIGGDRREVFYGATS